ncbi:MAG TPA: type II CAAX endopeptidase family protein [Candidatus Lustribacter sp.]|nr:type II CAAX endopeptidase family protein [Candidatus Lustribacter sp.]
MPESCEPAPRRGSEIARFLRAALVEAVPRDRQHSAAEVRHRRVVSALTLVVGAALLAISINLTPGDGRFYATTLALAAVWTIGALASGPLHAGWANTRAGTRHTRPVVQPLAVGLFFVGLFALGALAVARTDAPRQAIEAVLDHARYASLPVVAAITVVNGLAEELFFRGSVYAAIGPRRPVLWSTVLYAVTTLASGNLMLVLAALILGAVAGLQRRVTGGVLGPMITHVTWSMSMLLILPALLHAAG